MMKSQKKRHKNSKKSYRYIIEEVCICAYANSLSCISVLIFNQLEIYVSTAFLITFIIFLYILTGFSNLQLFIKNQ